MRHIQLMKKKVFPERMETLFEINDFNYQNISDLFDIQGGKW